MAHCPSATSIGLWTGNLPDEEATTVAGLVIHEAQMIPEEKQTFTFHGKRFVVLGRAKNRVTSLRVREIAGS